MSVGSLYAYPALVSIATTRANSKPRVMLAHVDLGQSLLDSMGMHGGLYSVRLSYIHHYVTAVFDIAESFLIIMHICVFSYRFDAACRRKGYRSTFRCLMTLQSGSFSCAFMLPRSLNV